MIVASSLVHFQNSNPNADRKPVIVVVEDEIVLRSLVATYLRESNFKVVEAGNAEEAVAVLNSGTAVDLVFADVKMYGKMDGVGLAHWINQHHRDIPVLVTTGTTQKLAASDKIPDDRFVPKPYIFGEIEDRIRKLIQAP